MVLADNIPKLSVLIPNFNGQAFLGRCLDSLAAQSERDFETLLIDNGSTDRSVSIAQEHQLSVRVLRLKENQGFAAAVNVGLDSARAELVAILNNDSQAEKNWLENLVRCASQRPEMDFFASVVLRDENHSRMESAGVGYTLQARAKPLFADKPFSSRPENLEVFLASGTAVLFRKSMVAKIGKMDPDYFAYLEDLDFFLRARLAGLRGMLCPGAMVYHKGASTNLLDRPGHKPIESSRRVFLISRNRWYLVWDNLPTGLIILLAPLIFWGWLRGFFYHLFRSGQISSFLTGTLSGFFSLPARSKKRAANKKLRRLGASELLTWMSKGWKTLP